MAVTTAAVIGATAAAAGAANSIKATNDAKKLAQKQMQQGQANVSGLDASIAAQSEANARRSAALEKQLTPEVSQLRTGANQQLLAGMNDGRYDMSQAKGMLNQNMGGQLNTPLLNAAIAKAQADLGMGGNLSQDAQNMATRRALSTAGTVGGGLGLGRDLVARDLGLSSMQVEQQRLANATMLGGQEMQLGQSNAGNFMNQINLLNAINQGEFGRNLDVARYAESIQRPIIGLDPGSQANLQIAGQNAQNAASANLANIKGQQNQNYINAAGQIGGALMAFNNRPQSSTFYTPSYTPATSPTGFVTPGGNAGVQTSGFFSGG